MAEPVITPEMITEGLGAFDELEFLGSGTFGDTYRTLRGDDEEALKVMRDPAMPEYLLHREVAALERVDHPNVVGFIGSGVLETDGPSHPYIRCEFISGGDARSAIDVGSRPDTHEDLRALLTGLLSGIAEMHDLGILHRDIKPANVALRDGSWDQPVLLDFGLARLLDMSSHTEYPAQIGTAAYMAPEQLKGQPARRRSDLFAIAAVVYEAGTGAHPFRTPDIATIQTLHDRISAGPPVDPRTLADWPDDVADVVVRLLSYWAHERLGVGQALRDLEAAI